MTENGKGFFSQSNKNKNNISVKSENLGLSSGKFKTNYNSIQNFNKNNLNNNLNNNLSNNPNLNVILNNINNNQTFAYNNSNRNALQTIHPYGDTAIYYETNLNSVITSPNNRNDIPVKFDDSPYNSAMFSSNDKKIEEEWYNYHKEHAILRYLCRKCNISRNKKNLK